MGKDEEGLPDEILKEVQVGEMMTIEKEVNIIFDKKQAMIRFPTRMTADLKLKKGDSFRLTLDKESKPIKIICELIRK